MPHGLRAHLDTKGEDGDHRLEGQRPHQEPARPEYAVAGGCDLYRGVHVGEVVLVVATGEGKGGVMEEGIGLESINVSKLLYTVLT